MKDQFSNVNIEGHTLKIKNLSKIIDASSNTTRAQIISYYTSVKEHILPHLKGRPFSQIVFTEGVGGESFYRKVAPKNHSDFLATANLPSSSKGSIEWALVDNLASMVYMVSLGCIEMHTCMAQAFNPQMPTFATLDLDPSGNTGFADTIDIAKACRILLERLSIHSVPKTSGKRGIHILIPVKNSTFKDVQKFLFKLCSVIVEAYPNKATLNRALKTRGDRIYLDTLQNAYGQTIAAPYSLRATNGLTVSMPIKWDDVNEKLNPKNFTINTVNANAPNLFSDFDKHAKSVKDIL